MKEKTLYDDEVIPNNKSIIYVYVHVYNRVVYVYSSV